MKSAINILLISIFLCSSTVLADELYGPNIFGLQLGMTYKDSKPIMDSLCTKYGGDISPCRDWSEFYSKMIKAYGGDGDTEINAYGILFGMNAIWINHVLKSYTLPLGIFNYNTSMDKRIFLEKLASSYNLSFECNAGDMMCVGHNNDIGYDTEINFQTGMIKISAATKTDELEFK